MSILILELTLNISGHVYNSVNCQKRTDILSPANRHSGQFFFHIYFTKMVLNYLHFVVRISMFLTVLFCNYPRLQLVGFVLLDLQFYVDVLQFFLPLYFLSFDLRTRWCFKLFLTQQKLRKEILCRGIFFPQIKMSELHYQIYQAIY